MISNFFLLALLILTTSCLAEVVSLRSRSQALIERPHSPNELHFLPPIGSIADSHDDSELLDIVLVASVDGKFHALNRTSGRSLWSMASTSTSESSVPATFGPLVRTDHVDTDPDLTDDDAAHQELYIIEPQSGDIYVMTSPSSPLQRMRFSMSQLVDMSPFSFSGDEDRRVFVGHKETSLLLIELETGKVKATLNSECPWDPFEELDGTSDVPDLDLDELDGTKPERQVSRPTEVFIGRTDYHISIHTKPLGPSSKRPPVQKLSFSTYGPNNQDNALQALYRKTADDAYIQSLPNGKIMSFKARPTGTVEAATPNSELLWATSFNNPIVAVFDVLRSSSRHQPFVLLQPHPRLQDVLPNYDFSVEAKLNRFPHLYSAYVGLIEETGALFAMSPDRFPLIIFGDSGDERNGHRLIDAPPDKYPETPRDLPPQIDSITEARKLRALCRNGSPDRRCLTGIRRLEESSRLSRWLLDGVPGMEPPESASQSQAVPTGRPNRSEPALPTRPWMKTEHTQRTLDSAGGTTMVSLIVVLMTGAFWFFRKRFAVESASSRKQIEPVTEASSKDMPKDTLASLQPLEAIAAPVDSPIVVEAPVFAPVSLPATPSRGDSSGPVSSSPQQPKGAELVEDADGDDSEKEGDSATAAGGKRKARRGKRGKKKKITIPSLDDEDEDAANAGNGSAEEAKEMKPAPAPPVPIVITSTTPNAETIASSLVVSDTVLGFGSHGTVVFQGSLQGRAVAVKRLLRDFVTLASREVNILQESDDHPNVIRYYYQEAHANFLYIALELCPASLADIIESPDQFRDISITFDPKRALRQIASGLRHLHALKLVHRDIKPQNILVSGAKGGGRGGGHRMLISDFGLCKKLDVDQTSFLPTAYGAMAAGTVGWRAPEILRGDVKLDEIGDDSLSSRGSVGTPTNNSGKPTRLTKSVDIFALGCLFYYALTNGGHPFGDRYERESNIMKNVKSMTGLERFGEEGVDAADLITAMLHPDAHERPDTTTCLLHPFFWDAGRRLTFLQDASDRFEIMCRDPRDPNLILLETDAVSVVGGDWHTRLDKIFIENLGKFRKYDGRSVQDLLRALRNKKNHYQDLPDNVKRHLGPMPDGFLAYFTRRFPKLFLHVHSVIASTNLRTESMFRSYFELAD